MAYTDLGFNQFLTRNQNNVLQLDPLQAQSLTTDFVGENITSAINGSLIGSGMVADNITTGQMSFDRARGGTLTLGGKDNENGVFSLLDENEVERISMDKDGIHIDDGSITITDSNNQTVLDSKGIVSTSAFKSQTFRSLSDTINGGSILFLSQIEELTFNITVTRPTNILITATIAGYNDNVDAGGLAFVCLAVDNIRLTTAFPMHGIFENAAVQSVTVSPHVITTLQPGNHYVKACLGASGGVGDAYALSGSEISYVLLGN